MNIFIVERFPELWMRTGEHVVLTGISTAAAILAGIPVGILAFQVRRLRSALLGLAGILQTIPSLAMLVILLILFGKIGALPAVIALTLYALLPIIRNTVTGLEGVSPAVTEAARGVGMTARQQLIQVRLPLALPVIIAGIRTAAVVGVGIATLSAFIGAGGLGQFINRGLALSNPPLILLGAVPAALLALLVDLSFGAVGWALHSARKTEKGPRRHIRKLFALSSPFFIFIIGTAALFTSQSPEKNAIKIGTKNFTEQFILGELLAQMIEANTDLSVERKFNLGGTMICHGALTKGEIDLYPEYTGTGLTAVLKRGSSDICVGSHKM